MSAILDQYRASGNLKAEWYPMKGSLLDYSGNANHLTTVTGTPTWKVVNGKRCIYTPQAGTNDVRCNSSDSLNQTTGTIVVFAYSTVTSAYQGFINKTSAGFNLFLSNGVFGAYDNNGGAWRASTYTLGAADRQPHLFAMAYQSGVAAGSTFYVDGQSCGTALFTHTVSAAVVRLAAGQAGNQGLEGGVYAAFLFSNLLTGQELSQLYQDLMASYSVLSIPKRNYVINAPKETNTNCKLHLDFQTKDGASPKKLMDLSGTGNTGTVTGTSSAPGLFGDTMAFDRYTNTVVVVGGGYTNTISGNDQHAISFWYRPETFVTNPIPLCSNVANYFFQTGASILYWYIGGVYRNYTMPNVSNRWTHVYVEKTGAGDSGNLYINNVLQTPASGTIASTPAASASWQVGQYSSYSTDYNFPGKLADLRMYSANLTAAERTALYLAGAKILNLNYSLNNVPPTLANVTSGYIPGTDWERRSGTWSVIESSGRRYLKATGPSIISAPNTNAYGTFCFRYVTSTLGAPDLGFIKSDKTSLGAGSTWSGYALGLRGDASISVNKYTSGSYVSTVAGSAAGVLANSTDYEFVVTRGFTGIFKIYIKGGSYSVWTLLATGTDTTHTISRWLGLEFIGTDMLGNLFWLEGVIDPTVNPELIPN